MTSTTIFNSSVIVVTHTVAYKALCFLGMHSFLLVQLKTLNR